MGSWVAEELRDVELGDERRNRRLVRIVEDLAAQPSASVPQAMRDNAAVQGVYEFWANRRVSAAAIIGAHARRAVERMADNDTVLAIQDTTELDFSNHRATRRLGAISKAQARGLKVHTVLATTAAGVPLGVLHQQVWARDLVRSTAKRRAIADKESHRWLESLEVTQTLISSETRVITIGDREADIYELFAVARPSNSELLIRAAQNRNTKVDSSDSGIQPLFSAIGQAPVAGQIKLMLQRTPRRAARVAQLSVRYRRLWLQPPESKKDQSAIAVWVVMAQEETPPVGERGVCWVLLSTLAVEDLAAACESLWRYSQRWAIERLHYLLKSGCRIEELQLESGDRLQRALATYLIVAWRLLWLTYEARREPEQSVAGILTTDEWQSLICLVQRSAAIPVEPPTLGESIKWIARLGGYLN